MSDARPEISFEDLDEMESVAKSIHEMPAGANKEKAIQAFKNAHAAVLEHMDMPVDAIAPDAHLLGILDWGSGAMRAAGGETLLGAKAIYDKATTGKTDWRGGEAVDRLTDAIVPMGDPARSGGEYLERFGLGEGGKLSDTWAGQKMGVERGGRFDLTGRGVLGFGLDAGFTPGNVKSIARGMEADALKKAAANMGPRTAAQLQKELEAALKEQALKPPRGLMPSMKSTTEGGKTSVRFDAGSAIPGAWDAFQRGISDPLRELGDMLYKTRFADADAAAEQAGKKLPSQIMAEHGRPGVTAKGIREGMRGIINRTENSIDQMNTPAEDLFIPTRQQSQFLTPVAQSHASRAGKLPGSSIPIAAAEEDALQQFEHAARQDPGVMRQMREAEQAAGTVPTGPNGELLYAPGAQQLTLPGVDKVTPNSGFQAVEVSKDFPRLKRVIDQPGKPGGMKWKELPDGSKVLEPYPPTPPTYKDIPHTESVPMNEMVWQERPPTVEPGRPVTMTEGRLAPNFPAPKSAIEVDRPMSWQDARQMRRSWQKQAADANLYTRRDPLTPGAQAKVDASAKMHNQLANRAGELELEMLDQAKPGLGGEVWNKHRDVSGLLTGAPYLEREFTGGGVTRATTGTKRAFAPTAGRAWDMLDSANGVLQAGGGKALMSPWTRKGLAPAARAMWLNDYWNREYTESDNNPYGMIKKYGVKK